MGIEFPLLALYWPHSINSTLERQALLRVRFTNLFRNGTSWYDRNVLCFGANLIIVGRFMG